jgi:hypothetical protein
MRHALDCARSCGLDYCNCGAEGKYRVLHDYPKTEKTGETTMTAEGSIKWNRVADWRHKGYANSMEDAKAIFGGYPVLEFVGRVQ